MPAARIGPIEGPTVLGAGTAFPPLELDNAQVLARIAERQGKTMSPERLAFAAKALESEYGLSRRAWCHQVGQPLDPEGELTSADLGERAARAALADAGIAPETVRVLLVATSSPHRMTSTVSAAVAARLGVQALCFDVRAGCAAGLFALSTAALYVAAGSGPALVIGSETFSKVIPPDYKDSVMSMADGAGALVLGQGEGALLSAFMETDGSLGHLVNTPGPMPPTAAAIEAGGYYLAGDPAGLKQAIPGAYLAAVEGALTHAGLSAEDVDAYVPHQVGRQVVEGVCAQVGFPLDKAWIAPERHANVGAAGWLVALAEARAEGFVTRGQRVALASVGGGMSWAGAVLRL
jgi:3-oxoacyl-[acyl-carrier-protein] synthase III